MNTETQKITSIQDLEASFTERLGTTIQSRLNASVKIACEFAISVLNDNISRLEAQKEDVVQKVHDSHPIEKQMNLRYWEGNLSVFNSTIENLRQEIQSLTSQLSEL